MSEPTDTNSTLVGGRYEIVRPLAAGGMAKVYVARHHLTRQEVALKVIESAFARDAAGVSRFLREVSVASRIQHEGVVKVFDAGFDAELGSPYLAMELLDGRSLAKLLADRSVDQERAMRYVVALLAPLSAAHDVGVIHRDLKPENVFVTRAGEVKLLDFGVARDLRGSRTETMEGTALGTVYYMAPEQALDARSVSAAADVYAVGVTMYQILCGIFPFDGTTPHAVLIRANREVAVPVGTRAPWLHPELAALVDRCLEKDPSERPADAATLIGLLEALLRRDDVIATIRDRGVNPATFLSTPPAPIESGSYDDPFESMRRSTATPKTVSAPTMDELPSPVASAPPAPIAPAPPAPRRARSPAWLLVLALPVLAAAALLWPRRAPPNTAAPRASTTPSTPVAGGSAPSTPVTASSAASAPAALTAPLAQPRPIVEPAPDPRSTIAAPARSTRSSRRAVRDDTPEPAPVANAPVANAPVANAPVANAPVANTPVANTPAAQPRPTPVLVVPVLTQPAATAAPARPPPRPAAPPPAEPPPFVTF